ncbi:hypothetical protein L211DRAFT_218854 [Terfezia boudieri ATCC MYA-4762]|uniref:Uncharacterized protein n=1 Tax=Terfezia boudieri ATCC MYA-4762 TaxID=1051890 RepID=A0A3N4LLE5_9PEZI|nr:hypothetical protein L211DRAFT_218854 [Terfezia boudieri ATCC MYA-4762]
MQKRGSSFNQSLVSCPVTRHDEMSPYTISPQIPRHRKHTTVNSIKSKCLPMMPISADALHYRTILLELSKPVTISPQIFDEYGRMRIRFIHSFRKSCCKLMVQYVFRNMSAD